ncbi:hypothetical protein [Pseudodesulfovibrio sp.]|uniref:hypothetical protein n=1 Tax=Pseudodesulfovibrio sp. TaxID=2035812 RepID=UPI00262C7E11|nr:hypothetical protein [Pseudodesulfovibrio sp.]MDD3310978.1 hypothetical protein [Pseudodesulfovibrio sp.]
MYLPLSSLPSQRLESGARRTTEAVQDALTDGLKACGLSREVVAEELSRLTGHDISVHTLNNWAAPSKEDRPTPLQFLAALIEITGSPALAEAALRGTGYKLLTPDQVPLYELGRITAEDKARAKRKRELWDRIG